jgi:putative lipoprotein
VRRLAAVAVIAAMPAAAETVTGTVTWAAPAALPPGAVLEVAVEDISLADAPSTRLAAFSVSPAGPPPVAFTLEVPAPEARSTVSVRATIRHEGALLFTSDTVAPVLTRGAPSHADLALISVSPGSPALTGIDWRITALAGAPLPPEARDPVLRFEAGMDGPSFAASAGCNRFGGAARIDGDALAFGPARATRMACPPPLDAADAALTAAFGATARWEIDGRTLRLRDAAGAILLEAAAP